MDTAEKLREKYITKAILAGLECPLLSPEENSGRASILELKALLETAGGECVEYTLQSRHAPDPRTFIGGGKVEELKGDIENLEAEMVIFDNPLSPSQQRVLAKELDVPVLDRAGLILDIFAQRAQTAEGRLQVELAQYQYLLPRLTGMWTHLTRQTASGGKSPIGTRGPGETQLETDRRHIRKKITRLKAELESVRRVRSTQRARRGKNEIPVCAIVGYTNAGKSTLLNRLTDAGIPANDRLFDTLDTTTRKLVISDTCTVLLSDTVGFISKLPHQLVAAFKATLEELEYADLILHVIDLSDPEWQAHMEVVDSLITELEVNRIPRLEVYNKCDLCAGDIRPHGENQVCISAKTGEGIDRLFKMIEEAVDSGLSRAVFSLPYSAAGLLDRLYAEAKVEKVEYGGDIRVTCVCSPVIRGQLRDYLTADTPDLSGAADRGLFEAADQGPSGVVDSGSASDQDI